MSAQRRARVARRPAGRRRRPAGPRRLRRADQAEGPVAPAAHDGGDDARRRHPVASALILLTCLGGYLSRRRARARSTTGTTATSTRRWRARPTGRCRAGAWRPARRWRSASCCAALSLVELSLFVNPLTAALLSFSGFLGYVFVYTIWLKRRTPQNIVIGGAAGAVPPLVGWAAVRGTVGGTAVLPVRDRVLLDAAALLGAVAADEGRVREGRRADAAGRPRRGRDAPPDPALHACCSTRSRSCPSAPAASAAIYLVASLVLGWRVHRRRRASCTAAPTAAAALRALPVLACLPRAAVRAMVVDVEL